MSRAALGRGRRLGVYAVGSGAWITGAAWLAAHYWLVHDGEFGPETSPAEPWALALHGGFAMASLWVAGLLWGVHVPAGWRARRGRRSGAATLILLALLTVSGYLLYYLADEAWRGRVSLAHWIAGLAALPVFLVHRLSRKTRRVRVESRSVR